MSRPLFETRGRHVRDKTSWRYFVISNEVISILIRYRRKRKGRDNCENAKREIKSKRLVIQLVDIFSCSPNEVFMVQIPHPQLSNYL